MRIDELRIAGYRSIRDLRLKLDQINVIVGPNGCGKTNLYRSIFLLQAAAGGNLARTLAGEGGMPSALWAGERRGKGPVRLTLGVQCEQYDFEMSLGLPQPDSSMFSLDPEIKEERLTFRGKTRVTLLERTNSHITARDDEGNRHSYALAIGTTESALAELREPERFTIVTMFRQQFLNWRFYHQFRTDAQSPIRQPQVWSRTPVLGADGHDLAAALQTIYEIGDGPKLSKAAADALGGAAIVIAPGIVRLHLPEFRRPFNVGELSDGTLRYLCLLAAMLTPRPPTLMAFNEPEASLHPDLMEPLARLIVEAGKHSQMWITTHSERLAAAIEKLSGAKLIRLEKHEGETRIVR